MNRFLIALLSLTVALMSSGAAQAQGSTVYSWVDENGVRHFSDRAPANQEAESKELPQSDYSEPTASSPTLNNEAIPEENSGANIGAESTDTENPELSYADQKRKEMQIRREEQLRVANERNRACLQARDQLARLEPSRRVFYTNEDGETERMNDDERIALVEESRQLVAANCD